MIIEDMPNIFKDLKISCTLPTEERKKELNKVFLISKEQDLKSNGQIDQKSKI